MEQYQRCRFEAGRPGDDAPGAPSRNSHQAQTYSPASEQQGLHNSQMLMA
jgi:hypothetical protein